MKPELKSKIYLPVSIGPLILPICPKLPIYTAKNKEIELAVLITRAAYINLPTKELLSSCCYFIPTPKTLEEAACLSSYLITQFWSNFCNTRDPENLQTAPHHQHVDSRTFRRANLTCLYSALIQWDLENHGKLGSGFSVL